VETLDLTSTVHVHISATPVH